MRKHRISRYIGACVFPALLGAPVLANATGDHRGDDDSGGRRNARVVQAELIGYQEVPSTSTTCEGELRAKRGRQEVRIRITGIEVSDA